MRKRNRATKRHCWRGHFASKAGRNLPKDLEKKEETTLTGRVDSLNRVAMHIGVLVQALWVLCVAGERVQSIELSVGWVVATGAQVLLLSLSVEVFAAVAEGWRDGW